MNFRAIYVIYRSEMMRAWNTLFQTLASPVISTSLYFIVFGGAIGSRIQTIDGVEYGGAATFFEFAGESDITLYI